METMYWPDEIREPAFEELAEEVDVRPEELKMAEMIIDNLTAPFDPTQWVDDSRKQWRSWPNARWMARRSSTPRHLNQPESSTSWKPSKPAWKPPRRKEKPVDRTEPVNRL